MPRFTISHHTGAKDGDHYDLMLEQGDSLRTWRLMNTAFLTPQPTKEIPPHRKMYLDYEGEVSGERGRIKIFDTGMYAADVWRDDRVLVALSGRLVKCRLLFTPAPRHSEDSQPRWIVADPSGDLRKLAAALLRESGLDSAPSPELEELRAVLAHEEQRVMMLVDQYTHGRSVDWEHAELDPDARRRLESEGARWKHPWIGAARAWAGRLSGLADELRKSRPAAPTP